MSKTQAPDPAHELMNQVIQAQEQRDELRRALEVIAVGDSADPVLDAGDTLVELGWWSAEALAVSRAAIPAPEGAQALTETQIERAWRLGFRHACDAERLNSDEEWGYKGANVIEEVQALAAPRVTEGADRTPAGFNRPPNGEPCNTEDWNAGYEAGFADGKAAPAPQAPVALTNEQIAKASRDAHIAFALCKHQTYEHALTRAVEAAHGIPAPQTKEPANG